MNNISYVYLISWTKLDTHYIGVRHALNCSPIDLWSTYFTSSKIVKAFRQINGEPDHIEILKEFDNRKDALEYEELKLKEFNVLKKENWLNQNIAGKNFAHFGPHSEQTRQKISKGLAGKKRAPLSDDHKRKISEKNKGANNGMFGKTIICSEETKEKIRLANTGKIPTEEQRKKMTESHLGKSLSKETKEKLSRHWLGRKRGPMSKETKEKLRQANLGKISPKRGKPIPEEQKRKISETLKSKIKNK